MTHASSVTIQVTPESKPMTPAWMGEVAAFAQLLTHEGTLTAITEQVRFTRARFGQYDLIDFVAVLIGYALSGKPTLLAFIAGNFLLSPLLRLPRCTPRGASVYKSCRGSSPEASGSASPLPAPWRLEFRSDCG